MTTLLPGKPWQPLWLKKSVKHGKKTRRNQQACAELGFAVARA
jgi:hypothetical protein